MSCQDDACSGILTTQECILCCPDNLNLNFIFPPTPTSGTNLGPQLHSLPFELLSCHIVSRLESEEDACARSVCIALRAASDMCTAQLTIEGGAAPTHEQQLHRVLASPALRDLDILQSCSNKAEVLRAAAARGQPRRLFLQPWGSGSGEVAEAEAENRKLLGLQAAAAAAPALAQLHRHVTALTLSGSTPGLIRAAIPRDMAAVLAPALQALTGLKELHLDCCAPSAVAALARPLPTLIHLEQLHIEFTRLNEEDVAALAPAFQALTSLRALTLHSTALDAAGAAALAPLWHTGLHSLRFSGNNIGIEGVRRSLVPAMAGMTLLTSLDLSYIGLDAEGAATLAPKLMLCKGIRKLDLSGNPLRPEGAGALVPMLGALTQLEELSLRRCNLKAEGEAVLAPMLLRLPKLVDIDID